MVGGVSRARFPPGPHLRGSRFSRLPPLRLPPTRRLFRTMKKCKPKPTDFLSPGCGDGLDCAGELDCGRTAANHPGLWAGPDRAGPAGLLDARAGYRCSRPPTRGAYNRTLFMLLNCGWVWSNFCPAHLTAFAFLARLLARFLRQTRYNREPACHARALHGLRPRARPWRKLRQDFTCNESNPALRFRRSGLWVGGLSRRLFK